MRLESRSLYPSCMQQTHAQLWHLMQWRGVHETHSQDTWPFGLKSSLLPVSFLPRMLVSSFLFQCMLNPQDKYGLLPVLGSKTMLAFNIIYTYFSFSVQNFILTLFLLLSSFCAWIEKPWQFTALMLNGNWNIPKGLFHMNLGILKTYISWTS